MAKVKVNLADLAKRVTEDTEKVVRGTLLGISARVVKGTPVGNPNLWQSKPPKGYIGGTLRGAWNANLQYPDREITNSRDSTGNSTIGAISARLEGFKMGQTFYLSNPQPYAVRVELGWSGQRPQGMLRVALANLQQYITDDDIL